jgi:hypothetical protein
LLSTSDPENIPFFSDELFRWAFWENKTGSGWDRKIKYSVKEYRELKAKVDELRDRIGKGALEAEKVGYVLGKREADLSASQTSDQISRETDSEPPTKSVNKVKPIEKDSKRKTTQVAATDEQSKPEPTRKKQKTVEPATSRRSTRSSGKTDSKA